MNKLVRDGYDAIAAAYARERPRREHDHPCDWKRERVWLGRFFSSLPSGARVLDLGCGNGEPIMAELVARGALVVGVDLAHEQAKRARRHGPVLEGDMTEIAFAPRSFDAAIAYDAIWHVAREEHARLFARLRGWLVDGAPALLTLGADDGSGARSDDLLGVPMFYGAWPLGEALALVRAAGFAVVDHHLQPPGHLIVLLRAR